MAFNPAAETARYIDSLGPEALQKAADYTSASHWMLLWGLLASAVVTWIIVRLGILDKLSAKLEKRGWALRTWLVGVTYFLVSAIISLPWSIYQNWGFEKSYGRTSQPLADFLMQDAIGTVITSLLGALFFLGIYALIRKAGKRWWLWSGGLAAFAGAATMILSPVLIEPLFNEYKPLQEGPVKAALVDMAAEAGIGSDRIFVYDGSRQSNNFTANVSGLFGSKRIAISDVALKGASLDEVKAVTGHEIGHYVSGHIWRMVGVLVLLAMVLFFLADRLFPRFARLFGSNAQIGDPVGLPILIFLVGFLGLFAQPAMNGVVRASEREADNYSLKHVKLPDALASALLKTAEYRYPRPSALQEALFYTHPSVEWRVRNAMEWKAKRLEKAGR
ncbi:M48 family peptidase [Sphingorhabdus pulchriflava]|uniref:M48 family peptidase n=1 Tax=Sphingorhabdus pulchriflava TaxID=2292257 RepID=A0A371BED5_9SPHN|nr:M48 family metallopeptidase [Sphingorhabdus pulchriflava]RDV05930.1 M48 family peptidase [Sphingorhabdus pulchriflava]